MYKPGIVVFVGVVLAVTAALPRDRRSVSSVIVGGDNAGKNEFPYQVTLQYYYSHFCGGSVLNEQYVLTAAHCVDFAHPSELSVVAGDYIISKNDGTEQRRSVKRIIYHEDYKNVTGGYDIALLEVSEPFQYNDAVQPIPLPSKGQKSTGKTVVSGWGTTSAGGQMSDTLQKVEVPVISNEDCQAAYAKAGIKIREHMLCAGYPEGGKDACQADSGGPLVGFQGDAKYLAGIVSWGISCALPDYPGVYTEVASFIDWINSKLQS